MDLGGGQPAQGHPLLPAAPGEARRQAGPGLLTAAGLGPCGREGLRGRQGHAPQPEPLGHEAQHLQRLAGPLAAHHQRAEELVDAQDIGALHPLAPQDTVHQHVLPPLGVPQELEALARRRDIHGHPGLAIAQTLQGRPHAGTEQHVLQRLRGVVAQQPGTARVRVTQRALQILQGDGLPGLGPLEGLQRGAVPREHAERIKPPMDRLVPAPIEDQHRACEHLPGLRMVAAPGHPHGGHPVKRARHGGIPSSSALQAEPEEPETVAPQHITSGDDEGQRHPGHALQQRLQRREVLGIPTAAVQQHLVRAGHEPPITAGERAHPHLGIPLEARGGAIRGMGIQVEHPHRAVEALVAQGGDRHGDVIEHAETAAVIRRGVVEASRHVDGGPLGGEGPPGGFQRPAADPPHRVQHGVHRHLGGIHGEDARERLGFLQRLQVGRVMHAGQLRIGHRPGAVNVLGLDDPPLHQVSGGEVHLARLQPLLGLETAERKPVGLVIEDGHARLVQTQPLLPIQQPGSHR
ncbi:conserved hypothetical protein [Stigmatella aurantiaca DW4/3-1]|uniref:Uncharacterized protein n=1 Tax=Stigmatella aurantiaca (strain DW4/3-1) TaxID=378806 RepID=Q08QL1_STIAD|nr:conserved hypothetical protein [Stigmatella aurantiaca DW4/3-1]